MNKLKKIRKRIALLLLPTLLISSCNYLDIVPDNVSTIDHAFNMRNEAEKYLFTCYSYMPRNGSPVFNVGFFGGDEVWNRYRYGWFAQAQEIAYGNQRVSQTYHNAWDGNWDGAGPNDRYPLFDGIRHCNVFLENVSDENRVLDLQKVERTRWIGEAEFLKAYYHFCLLRMYGPIPIMDEVIDVDASEGKVSVSRQPVDEVFNYIVALLDAASTKLPERITDEISEAGRITSGIAKGLKAKVLLYAASPLFNGNEDYSGFTDASGKDFFNQTFSEEKWKLAADAAKEAIEIFEAQGKKLYYFEEMGYEITDTTKIMLSTSQAVCARWNSETLWANTNSGSIELQSTCMPRYTSYFTQANTPSSQGATFKMAETFYSENGVPIEEDKTLDFNEPAKLIVATAQERFYIKEGYTTARINYNREPRFYASLAFDGSVFFKKDSPTYSDEGASHVEAKANDAAGYNLHPHNLNVTGYWPKKLINWYQSGESKNAISYRDYAWPELRLTDLYLMYVEAANEAGYPSTEFLPYLDEIRERAGLEGVVDSWRKYSNNSAKLETKEGMRDIIQRERMIELAFESHRFWDLRRWKLAGKYLNQPVRAWNVRGKDEEAYYQIVTLHQQRFVAPRDYFWPIEQAELLRNTNLVQNPGW